MEKLEEIKSACGEIFARATEPIVVAPPEFVIEGEVDTGHPCVHARDGGSGWEQHVPFLAPAVPGGRHLCSSAEQAYLRACVSSIPVRSY